MKSRSKWYFASALLIILLIPALVYAEKRYISDTLIVSLRDMPSLRGNVMSYLRSGDLLEVLEENDDGFILVRSPKGDEGWIQKKYTIDEEPKDLIIAGLENKLQNLKESLESTRATTASLKASLKEMKEQLKSKSLDMDKLNQQIASSKESVKKAEFKYTDLKEKAKGVEEIYAERDNLQAQVQDLDQEVKLLKVENKELLQTDRILWFLAGFGVFLTGWIMGKLTRKTRRSSISL